jgi:L-ascorbate metabolism protein UlaG (beta-lactamase superfamily)
MVISFLGGEAVKIQFGDTTIAYNPVSKHSKLKTASFGADIVLVSINHEDMNGVDQVSFGDKKPFVISGPGEYEIKEVFIKGLPSKTKYGGEERINTIYSVSLEGMNICFLGGVNTVELPKATDEAIEAVDILFVPIGGNGCLAPAEAYKLAVSLEPKIIVPIIYDEAKNKDALKTFIKESGDNPKPEPKLTLKKKDLEGKEAEVMVITAEN